MNIKKLPIILVILIFSFSIIFLFPSLSIIKANALDAVYVYLSRIGTNINGTTNPVEIVVALTPNQTIASGGQVVITFPDADDGMWCRSGGSLTITGQASSIVDLTGTDWEIDVALPNNGSALVATCTQGSGSGSSDTITITNVGTLTAATTYGFKLANGSSAGVIGTDDTAGIHTITIEAKNGSVIDSSTFDLYLLANDTVTVSATVEAVPTVNCSISSNSVNLGTIFPGGAYATASNTISISTSSNTIGYYWAVYGNGDDLTDAGLYKSTPTTYLIPSTGSGIIDLNNVGTEGFGITVSDPDGAGSAVVPGDFSDGSSGVFGALDRTSVGAQLILYQNGPQLSSDIATITYGARAGTSAVSGNYTEDIHFICGGYY